MESVDEGLAKNKYAGNLLENKQRESGADAFDLYIESRSGLSNILGL